MIMPERNIDRKAKELFIKTLAELKKEDDILMFLENLYSSSEVKDHSRRLLAAKMLIEGSTYEDIALVMGMGTGTINKIHFKTKGSPLLNKLFKERQ
ncbi:MAG: Trp family transcriptional regulator [Candidatus Berkelbacteria bacterium]|nr:Trp family transcriptional regulator [Candidatus Berkelbacteria bacterium]